MTPKRARREMLKPRTIRATKGGNAGWYYIEDKGLWITGGSFGGGVVLTWRQIEQALALRRAAK